MARCSTRCWWPTGGDRPAGDPDRQADGHPHRRGVLGGRRGDAFRRRGRRGGADRAGQPRAVLRQRHGGSPGRQEHRCAGRPPWLRVPVRGRRVRHHGQRRRTDLGRAVPRCDDRDGGQDRRAQPGGRGGRADRTPDSVATAHDAHEAHEAARFDRLPGRPQGGRRRRAGDGHHRLRSDVEAEYDKVTALAGRLFGDPSVFIERCLPRVRQVEVQILGLADGTVVTLGERECSAQRRHQKVAEETPAPGLHRATRAKVLAAARRVGEVVDDRGPARSSCCSARLR